MVSRRRSSRAPSPSARRLSRATDQGSRDTVPVIRPLVENQTDKAEAARQLVVGELAAVDRQDPRGLASHFSEDCEFVDLSDGSSIQGRAAFLDDLLDLFARVPDLHVVESRLAVEGGVVAAEIRLAGTPVAEWRGFPPSGRSFDWHTSSFYDLAPDGKGLLRERMYYDAGRLDRQLALQAA